MVTASDSNGTGVGVFLIVFNSRGYGREAVPMIPAGSSWRPRGPAGTNHWIPGAASDVSGTYTTRRECRPQTTPRFPHFSSDRSVHCFRGLLTVRPLQY